MRTSTIIIVKKIISEYEKRRKVIIMEREEKLERIRSYIIFFSVILLWKFIDIFIFLLYLKENIDFKRRNWQSK